MKNTIDVPGTSSFMSTNNAIHVCGELIEPLKFDHESYGEKFYSSTIRIERTSGTNDEIPLSIPEKFITSNSDYVGKYVVIDGQVRTYREKYNGESHVIVYVFVKSMYVVKDNLNENDARFNGFICKVLEPRYTPKGRQICDIILAVNREFNKSDYIPCVCWGANSTKAYEAGVGANLDIIGRLQSRPIKDGARTVYEISVGNLRIIG